MDGLYTFLKEGLLNKSNKTGLIPPEEVLTNAMTQDWQDVLSRYQISPMPTWVVKMDNDEASVFSKGEHGNNPVEVPIGTHVLAALKDTRIKKITAHAFTLGDWKTRNTTKELSNITLQSTNMHSAVSAFDFKGNWKLENVILKSDMGSYLGDYYGYNRSLIIKKNVKLQNRGVDIGRIGDTETLGYDYSEVERFKCSIPYKNPLSVQIIEWLDQKKEGVAKDEDLKKLIGNIPPIATSYEYVIEQDSTWNIHMKIYNDSMMKFNRDPSWDWNGLHIQAYRQRGANGKTYSLIGDSTYQYTKRRKQLNIRHISMIFNCNTQTKKTR